MLEISFCHLRTRPIESVQCTSGETPIAGLHPRQPCTFLHFCLSSTWQHDQEQAQDQDPQGGGESYRVTPSTETEHRKPAGSFKRSQRWYDTTKGGEHDALPPHASTVGFPTVDGYKPVACTVRRASNDILIGRDSHERQRLSGRDASKAHSYARTQTTYEVRRGL